MDVPQETKEKETQPKTEDSMEKEESKVREKTDETAFVKEAKVAAAEIKAQNDRREKLLEDENKALDRKEALNALGGGSPGGIGKEKVLDEIEYSKKLQQGELKMDDFLEAKNE